MRSRSSTPANSPGEALPQLADLLGPGAVLSGPDVAPYLTDATEAQSIHGNATAVILPESVEQVAIAMRWRRAMGSPSFLSTAGLAMRVVVFPRADWFFRASGSGRSGTSSHCRGNSKSRRP